MLQSRTSKSMKNAIFGMIGLFINLIVSFVAKSVFIRLLGVEFNGLNSLFTNILLVLSLAELGFAGSIAYALYKPLKDNDEQKIGVIMNYFAKVYRIVSVVVLTVGLLVIPFLQYLINEPLETLPFTLNQLRAYYGMFLANTVCSYLYAYKRTIITADQNAYLINIVDNTSNILLNALQIALLFITKNYYAFLGIMIARTVVSNVVVNIIANKKYAYLKNYRKEKISKEDSRAILINVKAMLFHKIGYVAVFGTISIIISAFVGVTEAGMYGNYIMIVSNIAMFVGIIFSSMTASIGNLCASDDTESSYQIYKKINYLACVIGVFCYSCYVALFQDFITLWLGEENLLQMSAVVIIAIGALVDCFRKATMTYKDAMGLFKQDQYKPIAEAIVGVALAIGLSYVWGVTGVILGYTIARTFIALPIENYVLFKKGFHKSLSKQTLSLLCYTALAVAVGAINYLLVDLIHISGIGGFVVKLICSVGISGILIILATMLTKEFKFYLNFIVNGFGKLKRKLLKR